VVYSDNGLLGFGNCVMILHQNGYLSLYAHTERTTVQAGWRVKRGERIALVGHTGYAWGPHLHFELRDNGKLRDPAPLFTGNRSTELNGPLVELEPDDGAAQGAQTAPATPATPAASAGHVAKVGTCPTCVASVNKSASQTANKEKDKDSDKRKPAAAAAAPAAAPTALVKAKGTTSLPRTQPKAAPPAQLLAAAATRRH
jgi:hypothetical protein